jgi:hypothetical protein
MQNKANFVHLSPEKGDFTKKQSQFKPNSKPIVARAKMMEFTLDVGSLAFLSGVFAWIRNITILLVISPRILPP